MMFERRAASCIVLLALTIAGCAARKEPDVPAGLPLRFPDFMFPAVPASMATAPAVSAHQRGWRLLQAGDLRNAERAFGQSLTQHAAFYPAEAGVGYVKLAEGAFDAAVTRFDRALARAPEYVPALVGRGEALLALNRPDEARSSFVAALVLDPSLTALQRRVDVLQLRVIQEHVARGRQAAEGGRADEAREAYRKAIAISPESAFLHRELAVVEQKTGDLDAAFAHAGRALELEPGDTRAMLVLADVHEARGDLNGAAAMLQRIAAIEPSDTIAARLAAVRERMLLASLPAEYAAIPALPSISRGELAALIGIKLQPLLKSARPSKAVVMTDTRAHWAASWILAVTRAGVMEPFANHTFQPSAPVRRGELARTAARALNLVLARNPALAKVWQTSREKFADLSQTHPNYPSASRAVSTGVMSKLQGDTFQLTKPVSGAEAVQAVERLEALATPGRR